jgi:hypothetical protein
MRQTPEVVDHRLTLARLARPARAAVAGAVLLGAIAVTGCGALGTEQALPPCGRPPSPSAEQPPPGAVLPDATRMTAMRTNPPLTQLNAYTERSPAGVADWIAAQGDLDIVETSPPGREIELLVTDGVYNTWMSARAICDGASVLAEVIARADSGAQLPPVRTAEQP